MRDRTFVNHTVRITVVKVACYTDLGEKYAQYRPGADRLGTSRIVKLVKAEENN